MPTPIAIPAAVHSQPEFTMLAWLPDDRLVLATWDSLWFQDPATREWHLFEVPFTQAAQCLRTQYAGIRVLPDATLGIDVLCMGTFHDARGRAFHVIGQLVSYDLATQNTSLLFVDPPAQLGGIELNATMDRGIYVTGGAFATPYWLVRDDTQPIPLQVTTPISLTLTEGTTRWFLPDSLLAEQSMVSTREIRTVGLVQGASWSARNEIAFWATLAPIGEVLSMWARYPWSLYILDPDTLQVREVLSDVVDVSSGTWSPDGTWVTYRRGQADRRGPGLWLLQPTTGQQVFVTAAPVSGVTWSPDSTRLAVIALEPPDGVPGIVIYDLATLVSSR